jgi:hypothetical protein
MTGLDVLDGLIRLCVLWAGILLAGFALVKLWVAWENYGVRKEDKRYYDDREEM